MIDHVNQAHVISNEQSHVLPGGATVTPETVRSTTFTFSVQCQQCSFHCPSESLLLQHMADCHSTTKLATSLIPGTQDTMDSSPLLKRQRRASNEATAVHNMVNNIFNTHSPSTNSVTLDPVGASSSQHFARASLPVAATSAADMQTASTAAQVLVQQQDTQGVAVLSQEKSADHYGMIFGLLQSKLNPTAQLTVPTAVTNQDAFGGSTTSAANPVLNVPQYTRMHGNDGGISHLTKVEQVGVAVEKPLDCSFGITPFTQASQVVTSAAYLPRYSTGVTTQAVLNPNMLAVEKPAVEKPLDYTLGLTEFYQASSGATANTTSYLPRYTTTTLTQAQEVLSQVAQAEKAVAIPTVQQTAVIKAESKPIDCSFGVAQQSNQVTARVSTGYTSRTPTGVNTQQRPVSISPHSTASVHSAGTTYTTTKSAGAQLQQQSQPKKPAAPLVCGPLKKTPVQCYLGPAQKSIFQVEEARKDKPKTHYAKNYKYQEDNVTVSKLILTRYDPYEDECIKREIPYAFVHEKRIGLFCTICDKRSFALKLHLSHLKEDHKICYEVCPVCQLLQRLEVYEGNASAFTEHACNANEKEVDSVPVQDWSKVEVEIK